MLYWALAFFVMALVAALLGFGGVATEVALVSKVLFLAFLLLAVLAFVLQAARRT